MKALALPIVLALILASPPAAAQVVTGLPSRERIRMQAAGISDADIAFVRSHVAAAEPALDRLWARLVTGRGATQSAPSVVLFITAPDSPCDIQEDNAAYCAADNTIYYDLIFLGDLLHRVTRMTGTRLGFGAVMALAHEWGHGVFVALGQQASMTWYREHVADCVAGGVARELGAGAAELEEARATFALVSDDRDGPITDRVHTIFTDGAHGDMRDRVTSFDTGRLAGVIACTGAKQ
jgi:predicted metalloprotease